MAEAEQTPNRHTRQKPRKFNKTRARASAADPFFWLVLIGLIPAVLVAWQVGSERPSWALRSVAVYRLEIGLTVFLGGYLIALALANAYKGKSIGRLGLPGGGEIDPKDPALQEASEGAAEFEEESRGGLRDLTEAVTLMNGRVSALEDRKLGERVTQLEDYEISKRLAALEQTPTAPPEGDNGVR